MKKIILTVFATLALTMSPLFAEIGGGSFGFKLAINDITTKMTDDIDSDGSIDTNKTLDDSVGSGSLFLEYTLVRDRGAMTIGVDYVPMDGDLDKRKATQTSTKAAAAGAAPQVSGTNSGEASLQDHTTIYIQPGIMLNDSTMLYLTAGHVTVDLDVTTSIISSTDIKSTKSIDGEQYGVGIKRSIGGGFIKLDYTETDYDKVSYTTTNSTLVTGDLDNDQMSISFGKSF